MSEEKTIVINSASLPPIGSAIIFDGRGDGGRVKIDVSASEVGALLLLQHHYAGKTFKVTIEPDENSSVKDDKRKIGR